MKYRKSEPCLSIAGLPRKAGDVTEKRNQGLYTLTEGIPAQRVLVFSNTTVQRHQFFGAQSFLLSSSHMTPYMTTEKTMCLTMHTFVSKVISLLFNTLPRHKDIRIENETLLSS